MAEFENKIKVVIEGSVTNVEVKREIEGVGAIVIVDNGKGLTLALNGDWNAAKVAMVIACLKDGFGEKMFHMGLSAHLMDGILNILAGEIGKENETEAAEEGEHGEEA